ncbi:hypothetical protein SAMN06296058_1438 [Pseudoxanthomonas indica]|uniref:Uncharacterized protein n=1 Tax=Pseudoxanthomonas indica TaxID=428993 RepID=A0A1T5K7I7_9GAMM|nr:hypothetical protein SAMN06296058_1438 [Pseudoxanthomonas indica]
MSMAPATFAKYTGPGRRITHEGLLEHPPALSTRRRGDVDRGAEQALALRLTG